MSCFQELSRLTVERERERCEKQLREAVGQEAERCEGRLSEQHERLTVALEEERVKQEGQLQQTMLEAQQQHKVCVCWWGGGGGVLC